MPGIHFDQVRARIALADVLELIGFVPCETSGDQVRGPCPVHHSTTPSSRSFSANLRLHIYRCFKCGFSGNQLDLYAAVTGLNLFEAAVALCERVQYEIPWMLKDTPSQPRAGERSTSLRPSEHQSGGELARSLTATDRIAPRPPRRCPRGGN